MWAFAGKEGEILTHRVRDDQDVRKQDRTIEAKAAQRLEGDLGSGGRIVDQRKETALAFPQRAVLRQIAPGLTHQPHRTAARVGPAQGIEEETRHRSGPIQ